MCDYSLEELIHEADRRLKARAEEVRLLKAALRWCAGSADFAPGGSAREGWEKIVQPLIKEDK